MLLTRRALALILIFAPLLAAATIAPALFAVAALYAFAVIAALAADWALLPRPRQLGVTREHEPRLSLGAENRVRVRVANDAPRATFVQVRDEFPDEFAADAYVLPRAAQSSALARDGASIAPRTGADFDYHVRPPRRGDYAFGDTHLRWWSALGLVVRQSRFRTRGHVKVYPNLINLRRYELMARRGHLAEIGLRPVRRLGTGSEFERLREYEVDDDYRRIDWNATARRGKPITREYQIERSQNVIAVLDCGRLMRPPVAELAKIDYAVNAALMLGYVAALRGDKVGLLAYADDVTAWLAPKSGQAQFQRMLAMLYNAHAQAVESDIARAVAFLGAQQRKRALLVFFTDVAAGITAEAIVRRVGPLYPRHLPLVVTIGDPTVVALAQGPLETTADLYQRAVAEQALAQRTLLLDTLRARGALTLDVPADQLTLAVVNRYLEIKARALI